VKVEEVRLHGDQQGADVEPTYDIEFKGGFELRVPWDYMSRSSQDASELVSELLK
jgi:hypothetical protein